MGQSQDDTVIAWDMEFTVEASGRASRAVLKGPAELKSRAEEARGMSESAQLEALVGEEASSLGLRQHQVGRKLVVGFRVPGARLDESKLETAFGLIERWVAAYSLLTDAGMRITDIQTLPVLQNGSLRGYCVCGVFIGQEPHVLLMLAERLGRSDRAMKAARALCAARCEVSHAARLAMLWRTVEELFDDAEAESLLSRTDKSSLKRALGSCLPPDKAQKVYEAACDLKRRSRNERLADTLAMLVRREHRDDVVGLVRRIAQSRGRSVHRITLSKTVGDDIDELIYVLHQVIFQECGLNSFQAAAWGDEYARLQREVASLLSADDEPASGLPDSTTEREGHSGVA